jgi:hypothetical protein
MNQIMLINAYVHAGQWVFDDPANGLDKEPFVCGADDVIDGLYSKAELPLPARREGNRAALLFSAEPFPGASRMTLLRGESGGNWYRSEEFGIDGWLCPAMFHYFPVAPREIYGMVKLPA